MHIYQAFMIGKTLYRRDFSPDLQSDHEHCTLCGTKFSANPGDLQSGFADADNIHWVCTECFAECKNEYRWTVSEK